MHAAGQSPPLSDEEKRNLLQLARSSLERGVAGERLSPEEMERFAVGPASRSPGNCFVSLHIGKSLRGCMGSLAGDSPLYRAVASSAFSAGMRDHRFSVLTGEELARCRIEISVLTPLTPIRSVHEIEVGRHGLVAQRRESRGLLLPQVATGFGWDAAEFLRQTYRKAGLEARSEPAPTDRIFVFEACIFGEAEIGNS